MGANASSSHAQVCERSPKSQSYFHDVLRHPHASPASADAYSVSNANIGGNVRPLVKLSACQSRIQRSRGELLKRASGSLPSLVDVGVCPAQVKTRNAAASNVRAHYLLKYEEVPVAKSHAQQRQLLSPLSPQHNLPVHIHASQNPSRLSHAHRLMSASALQLHALPQLHMQQPQLHQLKQQQPPKVAAKPKLGTQLQGRPERVLQQRQQHNSQQAASQNKYRQQAMLRVDTNKDGFVKHKPQQLASQVMPAQLCRSQSLHELIQLRATENGQRMRITGTLRGANNEQTGGQQTNQVLLLQPNKASASEQQAGDKRANDESQAEHRKLVDSQQAASQLNSMLQQSPSSTTSSSGFASNSNSLLAATSSTVSSTGSSSSASNSRLQASGKNIKLAASRDAESHKQASFKKPNTKVISKQAVKTASLLSIVDELRQSDGCLSPSSPPTAKHVVSALMQLESQNSDYDEGNASDASSSRDAIDRLQTFTKMRQLSQSELALSYLDSATGAFRAAAVADKAASKQVGDAKSGGKAKLLSLIKRLKSNSGSRSSKSSGGLDSQYYLPPDSQPDQCKRVLQSRGQLLKQQQQKHDSHQQANKCNKKAPVIIQKLQQNRLQESKLHSRSESLCNLSYDCDFELIKNCRKQQVAASSGTNESSLNANVSAIASSNLNININAIANQMPKLVRANCLNNNNGGCSKEAVLQLAATSQQQCFQLSETGNSKQFCASNSSRFHSPNTKQQQRQQLKQSHQQIDCLADKKCKRVVETCCATNCQFSVNARDKSNAHAINGNHNNHSNSNNTRSIACANKPQTANDTSNNGCQLVRLVGRRSPLASANGSKLLRCSQAQLDEKRLSCGSESLSEVLEEFDTSLQCELSDHRCERRFVDGDATSGSDAFSRKTALTDYNGRSAAFDGHFEDADSTHSDENYQCVSRALLNATFDVPTNNSVGDVVDWTSESSSSNSFTFNAGNQSCETCEQIVAKKRRQRQLARVECRTCNMSQADTPPRVLRQVQLPKCKKCAKVICNAAKPVQLRADFECQSQVLPGSSKMVSPCHRLPSDNFSLVPATHFGAEMHNACQKKLMRPVDASRLRLDLRQQATPASKPAVGKANFLLAAVVAAEQKQSSRHSNNLSANLLNLSPNDNFILKRKTPNAGLKMNC